MTIASTSYPYNAPAILETIGWALELPRSEYSTNFADLFEGGKEHDSYRAGLTFVGCIIGGFFFLWALALVVLKCKGKEVGCASGEAFVEITFGKTDKVDRETTGSGSSEPYTSRTTKDDEESLRSSLPSDEEYGDRTNSERGDRSIGEESMPPVPSRRELRSQLVFFFFGLVTLAFVPLAIVFAFAPLREAAASAPDYEVPASDILQQISSTLRQIRTASESSLGFFSSMPLNSTVICPGVNKTTLKSQLGVDFDTMTAPFRLNYSILESEIWVRTTDFQDFVHSGNAALNTFESANRAALDYLWLLPAILLCLSGATLTAMYGVFLSWKRESSRSFQKFLSYGLLPCFIAMSIICWAVAIASAIFTATASDGCLAGGGGAPNATVEEILKAYDINPTSSVYKYLLTYSGECHGVDPKVVVNKLEQEISSMVNAIWHNLSTIDAAGRANLMKLCGPNSQLQAFLSGATDIATVLTTARRSLESLSNSLECSTISAIYDTAVNDSLCTKVAGASAWGFVTFLALGISTMCLITLRASWRHNFDDDRIYDESEVAENMIVDEHEEYLAYISKYKHEWEEYGGINNTRIREPQTGQHNLMGTHGTRAVDEHENHPPSDHEPFDPYQSDDSNSLAGSSLENISFLSLQDPILTKNGKDINHHAPDQLPTILSHVGSVEEYEDVANIPPPIPAPVRRPGNITITSKVTAQPDDLSMTSSQGKQAFIQSSSVVIVDPDGSTEILSRASPRLQKPNYFMVPSPVRLGRRRSDSEPFFLDEENKEASSSMLKTHGGSYRHPSSAPKYEHDQWDDVEYEVDEVGEVTSTLGTPMQLSRPPIRSYSQHSCVQFRIVDEPFQSLVQRNVDRFSKPGRTRALTPTRGVRKIGQRAAVFESPSTETHSAFEYPE